MRFNFGVLRECARNALGQHQHQRHLVTVFVAGSIEWGLVIDEGKPTQTKALKNVSFFNAPTSPKLSIGDRVRFEFEELRFSC